MTAGWRPGAVLCAGRIYCDLVFSGLPAMPRLGHEVFASAMTPVLGGGAFITAAHLVAQGRPANLLSRFGTDAISRALEDQFAGAGVGMELVERHPDAGPQLTVVMAHNDDRAFLSKRAGEALPANYAERLRRSGATHLHIAEYATLADNPELIADAKQAGMSVSLDPSWDAGLIGSPDLLPRCAGVDLFLPNLEEALAITGQGDAAAALEALAAHFPAVAVKLGADGAVLAANGTRLSRQVPRVEVRDTTGAGDAFNAGFIHAWLDGKSPDLCLAAAVTAGSLSVEAIGGTAALARPRRPSSPAVA